MLPNYLTKMSNHSSKPMQRAKPNPMAQMMSFWLSFMVQASPVKNAKWVCVPEIQFAKSRLDIDSPWG